MVSTEKNQETCCSSPQATSDSKSPGMKPLDRVLAVLRGEEPDRVPHFEWVHNPPIIEAMTSGGSYFDLVEQLDLDGVMTKPAYRKEKIDDDLWLDEWGATAKVSQDGYPVVMEDRVQIKTLQDLENWNPPDPDEAFRYEPIQATIDRFGGHRAIILQMRDVWSGPRDYVGYIGAMMNLIECPELVEGVVAKCVDHYIRIIERAAEMGVTVVFTGDDVANSNGPLFSPQIWGELLLPHYKRLVDAIHVAGLYHWKHSDGNLYPFLDMFVDAGTDGIDPIDPSGGMELSVVKAKYGGRVAIKGNVDQVELLAKGTPNEVVESVKACIRDAGVGGGYVCSSSNSIHSGVDVGLYRVMVDAIHQYGNYPLDMDRLAPTSA